MQHDWSQRGRGGGNSGCQGCGDRTLGSWGIFLLAVRGSQDRGVGFVLRFVAGVSVPGFPAGVCPSSDVTWDVVLKPHHSLSEKGDNVSMAWWL